MLCSVSYVRCVTKLSFYALKTKRYLYWVDLLNRGFGSGLLETHKKELTQLINRDKNRPSVVIWSVANEPRSDDPAAENYFK